MWNHNLVRTLALTSLFVLTACGGGGGSSGPVTSTETFQLRTAWINSVNDSRSFPFTITGTASGASVTGSGTLTQGAATSTTFESQNALQKTTTVTGSFTANGSTLPLTNTATTYTDTNYNPLGRNDGTEYAVVSGSNTIPTTARVNDTGTWYSTVRYSTSAKTTRLGTQTISFVLEPDTFSTALLKIINVERDNSNVTTSITTATYRLTPAGGLTRLSESSVQGTISLTVTY